MRLYNAIIIHDVYVTAESSEKAREAVLAWIAEGATPSESVAYEANREGAIRQSWRDQRPLVAGDVSDEDFEAIKGKTTLEIFEHIYTKRG